MDKNKLFEMYGAVQYLIIALQGEQDILVNEAVHLLNAHIEEELNNGQREARRNSESKRENLETR